MSGNDTIEGLSKKELGKIIEDVLKRMQHGESLRTDGVRYKKAKNTVNHLEDVLPFDWAILWDKPDKVYSYWILLVEGLHLKPHREIVSEALLWHGLHPEAEIAFYQSNEPLFTDLYGFFEVEELPCMIASNNVNMSKGYIKFESEIVREIQSTENGITDLLTKLHTKFRNKRTLEQIRKDMRTKRFWKGVGKVYEEVKGWREIINNAIKVFLSS